jgi:hypothetical protein
MHPLVCVDFVTGAIGVARIALTPQDPGFYQVESRAQRRKPGMGVGERRRFSGLAAAGQQAPSPVPHSLSYARTSANIFIPNPFPAGGRTDQCRRQEILYNEVVELTGSRPGIQMPIYDRLRTNI